MSGTVKGGDTNDACLCRPDLIPNAQKRIKDEVTKACAKEYDVEVALKVYNDYCASNGFSIPGYTYISTQTVRVSTGTGGAKAGALTATPTDGGAGGGGSGPAVTTAVGGNGVPPWPWNWMHLLSLLALSFPIFRLACAQMIVVTHTETPPAAGFSSVVTTRQTILTEVLVSTYTTRVTPAQNGNFETRTTRSSLGGSNNVGPGGDSSSGGGSDNDGGGGTSGGGSAESSTGSTSGKSDLTQLEVAGIVIGIIFGIIPAIGTVWMCLRGHRKRPMEDRADVR
ncbi:hypothetical protein B0T16DRAFT_455069 [Cercophora newfieldiana]|uniref:Uncharacterized protein n=1 Tax=Cercophora newfieldiana TaxID=92897 RepID=A0AA39YHI0_9PEZI|nr:hypothetical protein B0T16DRAFT_455069 [Cercophora newfieldiana]